MAKDVISEGDIEWINKISSQESCGNLADVAVSGTVQRILNVVEKSINKGNEWTNIAYFSGLYKKIFWTNIAYFSGLYKKIFIDKLPITSKQRDELEDFFESDEVKTGWDQILSKLSIQQSDKNKEFIRMFLEGPDGKYDSTQFIEYVLLLLGMYPLVVDIDLVEWGEIKCIKVIEWAGELYPYVDTAGKYKLFLIDENKKIIYFDETFEQEVQILENGLIFWVETRWTSHIDDIIDISKAVPHLEHEGLYYIQVWTLYRLDPETKQLEQIYTKEWITSVDLLDKSYSLFQTKTESGKKWVIKIREGADWDVSEILQELYDRISMWPDGLIVTESDEGSVLTDEDDEVYKETIVGIHIESWDDSVWPNEKLIGKTLLGESVKYHGKCPHLVEFYDDTNICRVLTTKGYNHYTIDREKHLVSPIEWLQWTDNSIDDYFFEWALRLVKENEKSFVKVFDKETNTVRDLVEIRSNLRPRFPHNRRRDNILEIEFYGDIYASTTSKRYFYFYEWKLYSIKKWFEVIGWNIHKVRFLLKGKKLWISFHQDFDKISEFLEEIPAPAIIVTK